MANWHFRINYNDAKAKYRKGEITIPQLCGVVVEKLQPIHARMVQRADEVVGSMSTVYTEAAEELADIIYEFEAISTDGGDGDDYDDVLEQLYDWADTEYSSNRKWLWIEPS